MTPVTLESLVHLDGWDYREKLAPLVPKGRREIWEVVGLLDQKVP